MDEQTSLIERTRRLLARVDVFQKAAKQLRMELIAYGQLLQEQLAALEEATGEAAAPAVADDEPSEDSASVEQATAPVIEVKPPAKPDRRKSKRKEGPPIPLVLSYSKTGADPFKGWVNDCSGNGLGITVEWALPVSSILSIRPVNAPNRLRWFQVEVRNCRKIRERWHLGCKFLQELSPEDLDYFDP